MTRDSKFGNVGQAFREAPLGVRVLCASLLGLLLLAVVVYLFALGAG